MSKSTFSNKNTGNHIDTISITGCSDAGGILMKSNTFAAFASRNEAGEIVIASGNRNDIEKIRKATDKQYASYTIYLVLTVILLLAAMVSYLCFIIRNGWDLSYIIGAFVFCIVSYTPLIFTFVSFTNIYKDPAAELTSRKNHASEHMAINAYDKLGRLPSIAEIKAQSILYPECGCAEAAFYALGGIFAGLAIALAPKIGPALSITIPAVIYCILFIQIAHRKKHVLELFELPRVKKPDDAQIELALAALRALIELEEKHAKKNDRVIVL